MPNDQISRLISQAPLVTRPNTMAMNRNRNYDRTQGNMTSMMPRLADNSKYGSMRQKILKDAEKHIFSANNSEFMYTRQQQVFSQRYTPSGDVSDPAHVRANTHVG